LPRIGPEDKERSSFKNRSDKTGGRGLNTSWLEPWQKVRKKEASGKKLERRGGGQSPDPSNGPGHQRGNGGRRGAQNLSVSREKFKGKRN